MAKTQTRPKLVPPPDTHVPDTYTQLNAIRLYAAAYEADALAQKAQQQAAHWSAVRDKAATDYSTVVQAARMKLPPPPDGKAWRDNVDAATKELSFVLVDAAKEAP